MPTFQVENFGCRAAQADGSAIEQQLRQRGLVHASGDRPADVVVLNTCTVTAAADRDVRARIRSIHRQNQASRILVTGCYAQRAPQDLQSLPGVAWVVGNSHKHAIGDLASPGLISAPTLAANHQVSPSVAQVSHQLPGLGAEILVGDIFAHTELTAAPLFGAGAERTRPNLKVQDGCSNRCSFCIIPSVRGQSRSLRLDDVVRQVNALLADGYREVVLSGINLGRWGRDLHPGLHFEHLLRAVLAQTGIEKLRISSVEPMDWSDELIELLATSARIAKHAHVPLQSGSDSVLRRMHRKYRPWHYAEKLRKIRAAAPTAAIGADVMAGFPGETAEEFAETLALVEELPFTYLHVFTYSARPGTPAAALPNQVAPLVARERNRLLREAAARKKRQFMESFLRSELPAITLDVRSPEWTEALTDNYLKLRLSENHPPNHWIKAYIHGMDGELLMGTTA